MKKHLLTLLCLFLLQASYAQDSLFARVYYNEPLDMNAFSAARALDGGIVMAGDLVMKIDSLGNVLWKTKFHSLNYPSTYTDVIATKDSNYVAAGFSYVDSENRNIAFFTKFNKDGDTLWTRNFGLGGQDWCTRACVADGIDSNYLLAWSNSWENRSFLAKVNKQGDLIWDKVIDGGIMNPREIIQAQDSSIYMIGFYNLDNGGVFKFDGSGNKIWTKSYASCVFDDLELVGDSIYIALSNVDFYANGLAKMDTSGIVVWASAFQNNSTDWFENGKTNMCMLSDTSFLIQSPSQMVWNNSVTKADRNGNVILERQVELGGTEVLPSENKGAYFIGVGPLYGIKLITQRHIGVIRTDSLLQSANCSYPYGNLSTLFVTLIENPVNVTVSNSNVLHYPQQHPLIQLEHLEYFGCVSGFGALDEHDLLKITVFPNGSDGLFNFETNLFGTYEVGVVDVLGRNLIIESFQGTIYQLDMSALPSGTYHYRLRNLDSNENRSGLLLLNK